jgi:hypothetical protein
MFVLPPGVIHGDASIGNVLTEVRRAEAPVVGYQDVATPRSLVRRRGTTLCALRWNQRVRRERGAPVGHGQAALTDGEATGAGVMRGSAGRWLSSGEEIM